MTNKNKKEKRTIPLRDAGEVIITLERPSKVLYDLATKAEEELLILPTTSYHLLPPPTKQNISPKRDYTKVANSIARDAIPSGLFKGTSKATYDVLYLRTRGAINPIRSVKAVQSDVLLWANVSHNTLRSHLKHLQSVGLLKVHYKLGDNNGAEYEIFLPEEIDMTSYHPLPPPTTSQNVVGGTTQNLVVGGGGLIPENTRQNVSPKTSLKTNTKNDDEAFAALNQVFAEACEKISGKSVNKNQQGKWKELAELLIMELEVASARTNSVSDVPAFLTEHLRRRLMPVKREEAKTKSNKSSEIEMQQPSDPIEIYQAEPLNEQGRESTLKAFSGYVEKGRKEFLMGLQDSYTIEDWKWLMKKLEGV